MTNDTGGPIAGFLSGPGIKFDRDIIIEAIRHLLEWNGLPTEERETLTYINTKEFKTVADLRKAKSILMKLGKFFTPSDNDKIRNTKLKSDDLKSSDEPNLADIAKEVMSREKFITFRDNEEVRYYKDGAYVRRRMIKLAEEDHFDKGAITERIFSKNGVGVISELVKKFSELEKTHEGNMGIDLEEIRNVKGLMPEYLLNKALYLSQEVRGEMTLARKIRYILFVIGNIREVEECYRVNVLGKEYLELSPMNIYEKREFVHRVKGPYCKVWNFMLNTIKTDVLERGAEVRIMSYPELITIFFEKILKNVALNNVYDFEIEDALLSEGKDVKEAIQSISSAIEAVGVDHYHDLISDPFESGFAKEVISGYRSVMARSDKLNTEELKKAVLLDAYLIFTGFKLSRYSETFKRIKERAPGVPGRSKTFI